MEILVIGGTGFISSKIVEMLLECNHSVSMVVRGVTGNKFADDKRVKLFLGGRNDKRLLEKIISEKKYDAVYDMIAYELYDSQTAYEIFKGKIGRFIHCSTVSVYMISAEVNCPITEDQDGGAVMPHFPKNPFGMDYGIRKRECEKFLWSVHNDNLFPVTAIRPPYVCGPGDRAARDFFWIERIIDGKPLLVPGSGDFATQTIFVDDLASAFVKLLDYPDTKGNAYNVASEEVFSLNDYLHRLAGLLDKEIELIHIEQNIFDELPISYSPTGDVFTFNTRRTALFSLDKIKSAIGFRSTPFDVWMPETIDWFLNKYKSHSAGYERRDDEIKIAKAWKNSYSKFAGDFLK